MKEENDHISNMLKSRHKEKKTSKTFSYFDRLFRRNKENSAEKKNERKCKKLWDKLICKKHDSKYQNEMQHLEIMFYRLSD